MFQIMGLAALFGSSAMAWRWGGNDEKLASIGFMLATAVTPFVNENKYYHPEVGVLLVDLVLLTGLMVLALRSDRFWPMWAAAFQLVAVTVHVASFTEQGDLAWAYAVGLIFWSYPVMISLMIGTWLEGRFRPRGT